MGHTLRALGAAAVLALAALLAATVVGCGKDVSTGTAVASRSAAKPATPATCRSCTPGCSR